MRIRQGGGKRLKPSKTRCGRQESCRVVRNPINLNFVIINSSRSYVFIIFMILIVQPASSVVRVSQLMHFLRAGYHHHEYHQSSWASSTSAELPYCLIFPSRQVTSSRSSVLDLLLLTKAVSKNWNFVSTFNTWRLWNRLMYDLNKLWKLWSTYQQRKFQWVRCN